MKTCPNCLKKLNNNFSYCNECGSELEGQNVGDFRTGLLNVFKIDGEFAYLFAVRGRQVVLKADSLEELEELVRLNRFPWEAGESSLLNPKVSLTENSFEECAIIGVSTLSRNPQYSNLDKLFK
jgi:hypothetical protein